MTDDTSYSLQITLRSLTRYLRQNKISLHCEHDYIRLIWEWVHGCCRVVCFKTGCRGAALVTAVIIMDLILQSDNFRSRSSRSTSPPHTHTSLCFVVAVVVVVLRARACACVRECVRVCVLSFVVCRARRFAMSSDIKIVIAICSVRVCMRACNRACVRACACVCVVVVVVVVSFCFVCFVCLF